LATVAMNVIATISRSAKIPGSIPMLIVLVFVVERCGIQG
jgi:hypothetical protein